MAQAELGVVPTQLIGGAVPATLIKNTHATLTVELCDTEDGLGTGTEFGGSSTTPLGPGATVTWPTATVCFGHSPGGPVTLILLENGAGLLPSADEIAVAIIDQGLAQQIADDINLIGVPAIDVPFTLYSGTPATGSTPVNLINVSAYQSLLLGVAGGLVTNQLQIQLLWFADPVGLIQVAEDWVNWAAITGSAALIVKGEYLTISVAANPGSAMKLNVVSSYRQLAAERFANSPTNVIDGTAPISAGDGSEWNFSASMLASASFTTQIPSRNGRAQLLMRSPGALQVIIFDSFTNTDIAGGLIQPTTLGLTLPVPFIAPKSALSVTVTNEDSSSAHTPTVGISFAD